MPFSHRQYNYERGLRSRPRSSEAMAALFNNLEAAADRAADARATHRRRKAPTRSKDLRSALANLEQYSVAVRQEQARCSRDSARRATYGPRLTALSRRAQYERHALRRMIANDV